MKKFIFLSILGLLIIAFSGTVYAQPKLTFSTYGYVEVVTVLNRNMPFGANGNFATFFPGNGYFPSFFGAVPTSASGAWNRTVSFWEERTRLWLSMAMDKGLSATVGFEMDSGRMGETLASSGIGTWNTDQIAVEVMHAYLTAGLPYFGIPIPMTVRAGIQPLAQRPNVFLYTDGPAITGTLNINPVLIGLTWAKAIEGKDATADDSDVYAITANAKFGPISVGGFAYYYNMNTYPFNPPTATYGVSNPFRSDMWWFGINSDGKIGPVNYNFDFVYDYGKVSQRGSSPIFVPGARDVDYRGWVVQGKVTVPWEKFAFGGLGMYATGADLNKTSRFGLPGEATAGSDPGFTRKVGAYVIPPGSEEWAIWGESMVFNNNYITATATPVTISPIGQYANNMTRGAIGGTWVGKLFASVSPVPWYKVTLQGMYIGDTTKHGNTLGDAIKHNVTNFRDDKTIGWEVDLLNDIKIYNNLTWSVGGGYLFAGGALDQNVTAFINQAPKNPWIVATKLRYDW